MLTDIFLRSIFNKTIQPYDFFSLEDSFKHIKYPNEIEWQHPRFKGTHH